MRNINVIAHEIINDWTKPYFGAIPYLNAMKQLSTINDKYGVDNAKTIINYFLANAGSWRGDIARRIKKELKEMIK